MAAHAEFLRAASQDENLAIQLKTDFRKAQLSEGDFWMLEFVEKLTLFPWLMVESDVKRLRQVGFSDLEILHIVLGCAHFSYLNRMADGIGIRLDYTTSISEPKVLEGSALIAPLSNPGTAEKSQGEAFNSDARKKAAAWIDCPEGGEETYRPDEPQNLFRAMGANPEARNMAREWRNYQLKGTPGLEARQRARIALFISFLNRSDYSITWYQRALSRLGEAPNVQDQLAQGKVPDNVAGVDYLLFLHARRLTQEPWTAREEHIKELLQAGLDDMAILQLTMLSSYLSFENRLALGLGVSLE